MDTQTLQELGFINTKILSITSTQNILSMNFENIFKNVVSVEINSAQIPNSEFNVEQKNNSLTLIKNSVTYTITLDIQQYSPESLVVFLNTKLNEISIESEYLEAKEAIRFFSSESFKLDMINSTCNDILGYSKQLYSTTNIDGVYTLQSINKCNFDGTSIIHLHSSIDEHFDAKCGFDGPLAVFYLNNPQLFSLCSHESRFFHPLSSLSKLNFEFKDSKNNFYNFRGMYYNLQIQVKYIEYGKNWKQLNKDSVNAQAYDLMKNMIQETIQETIKKHTFNDPVEIQNTKQIETKSNIGFKLGLAGFCIGGGFLAYKQFKSKIF